MGSAIALALEVLQAVEQLVPAVTGLIQEARNVITTAQNENRDPTDAEWASINTKIKSLLDDLNKD